MKFDLRLKSEDITLTTAEGVDKEYLLVEATGTQRDKQEKFVRDKADKDGKIPSMEGIKENFLGMLLWSKDVGTTTSVGSKFFDKMPGAIRDQLFDIAQQLSGMKTEAELLKLLMERELDKMRERQRCEDQGLEYIDPDEEEAKRVAEEKASGKE